MKFTRNYRNNGKPIRVMTPKRNARKAAIAWSEGRESLRKVLEFCIKNRICTMACCAGHDSEENDYSTAYISFSLRNQNTLNYVIKLFSQLIECDGIKYFYFSRLEMNKTMDFSFYITAGKEDDTYEQVLKILENIKDRKEEYESPVISKTFNALNNVNRDNIWLTEVTYDKSAVAPIMIHMGGYKKELTRSELSEKEYLGYLEDIQQNPELFNIGRKNILENIYTYCKDQKEILYTWIKTERFGDKKEDEKDILR